MACGCGRNWTTTGLKTFAHRPTDGIPGSVHAATAHLYGRILGCTWHLAQHWGRCCDRSSHITMEQGLRAAAFSAMRTAPSGAVGTCTQPCNAAPGATTPTAPHAPRGGLLVRRAQLVLVLARVLVLVRTLHPPRLPPRAQAPCASPRAVPVPLAVPARPRRHGGRGVDVRRVVRRVGGGDVGEEAAREGAGAGGGAGHLAGHAWRARKQRDTSCSRGNADRCTQRLSMLK